MNDLGSAAELPSKSCFLGVDVGGTFTDLVFFTDSGEFLCIKQPSTPSQPGLSTLLGLDEIRSATRLPDAVWRDMVHTHSSTVATNALIERNGARLGLITTTGFRDMLEVQRLAIPKPMRYDSRRPTPLVSRGLVRDIPERIDADGNVVVPLDREATIAAAVELMELGVTGIVVCFMHSYRNPRHEQEARAVIAHAFPELQVDLSSDVWPQAREFERATLTCVNAFVRPVVHSYVSQLRTGLVERGIESRPRGARSNGGMESLSSLAERPVTALLSGPAAGVAGAASAALDAGWTDADLLTIDVGGTSADIGVVRRGRPVLSSEEHIADFPILIPSVAVSAIGAGGGSIIWLDPALSLKVGPRSVGSDPGPACYGNGNLTSPALSDAFLLTGLLGVEQRLGAKIALRPELARQALEDVGRPIGLSAAQVADGAIRIAVAMMASEATRVLARRGVDLPKFRLVAYGGAGPLLAALLAEEIYIDTILIPAVPGALSAMGAARSDLAGDFISPVYRRLEQIGSEEMPALLAGVQALAESWMEREAEGVAVEGTVIRFSAEMHYEGQGYDVNVPLDPTWMNGADSARLAAAFHAAHQAVYGHNNPDAEVWLKELRAHMVGRCSGSLVSPRSHDSGSRAEHVREIRLRGRVMNARVLQRSHLRAGVNVAGPAIIEQMDTTTLIPDGWAAEATADGAMILTHMAVKTEHV